MTERKHGEPQEQSLIIEPGKIFSPFEEIKHFNPVDLYEAYTDETMDTLIEKPINFQGIKGEILMQANFCDEFLDAIVPIGNPEKVGLIVRIGTRKKDVVQAPLTLNVVFYPKSLAQYETLKNYMIKVSAGEDYFFLDCIGTEQEETIGEALSEGEEIDLYNHDMIASNGFIYPVVFPYDLDCLKQVKMEVITVEEFQQMPTIPPKSFHR